MAETLTITASDKSGVYGEILPQIEAMMDGEDNLIANLANITAILNEAFHHLWTGFYLRDGDTLVLGPFQGPLACTRIPLKPVAKGVCGVAANSGETQIVPDVNQFPGHIACSSASKSEIVVPLMVNGYAELVLDIDSAEIGTFDETDNYYCKQIIALIKDRHF